MSEAIERKVIEKLFGYDIFLINNSLLSTMVSPYSCEKKPKIVIICPGRKSMKDMEEIVKQFVLLSQQPEPSKYPDKEMEGKCE